MKKLLAIVISMAMIVAMMPMGVFAAEEEVVPVKSIEAFNNALSNTTGQNINIRLEDDLVNVGNVIAIENGKNITIDMNGKNISFSSQKHFTVKNGTLEFKGTGTVSEAEPYFGPVILKGGSQQTETNHSNVIVGENITLRGWSALFIDQNKGSNYGINATVNGKLEGLADTSGDKGSGIYINGQIAATTGAVPNIKIGSTATIESVGDGIYAAGYAKWNIEGAKITGATGIEIRAGELTVSENTEITGTSAPKTVTPNGNGSTTDGAGIAIAQHTTGLPIDVKIISGDIKGFSALYESNPQKNSVENIAKVKIAVSGGNFTAIKGGTNAIYSEDKKNFITGGTFSDLSALDYLGDNADVTVELAENVTLQSPVDINKGNVVLDLKGKTLSIDKANSSAVEVNGAKLTINDSNGSGKIESKQEYGIYALNGGEVIVNAGTIESEYAALTGNNTTGDMNFKVNGGTLTAKKGPAIYMPGQVELTMTNGILNGGISLRMGQVNISGGIINAITENIDSPAKYYDYSGNAWMPDALYVFGGTYASENVAYGNSLNLNITGGTFNCQNEEGSAVAIYDLGKVNQKMNVSISGNAELNTIATGRNAYDVLSLSDIGVATPKAGFNNPEYTGKVTTNITGGMFSTDPSKYVPEGYTAAKNANNKFVVSRNSTGGAVVPPATDNVTNNTTDKNTTADLTPAVKDNKAETTVDAKTADKIVEKALENKSEEIIVDAAGNNTVASSEVGIPEKTVKEIAEKTDASLVIKTDNGKVDLDKTALAAVAEQAGTDGTVKLVVETVKTDENICHVDLKLITSNGAVKDFRGGNVKVTINLTKELAAKDVVCVYINDNGIYTLVNGQKNADGTYTFTTGHFSEYAVMAKAEADKKIAEQLNTLIKEVNLKVRTSKTAKKNIKAVVSGDVKAITDAGYTVKYKFYRSEKKASKYEAKATKAGKTYINTAGKKGTKYYYKAKALVYDGDKLVGQTVLTQCKYGVRTWSK